jgi:membrane protein YqaA with SNARE-associated domain
MLQRFLHRLADAILPVAQTLGGPGVALIAFLDSSFLTFPEVSDALIVVLTVAHPAWWFYYGALATVGSTLGCVALFVVARKGGDAVLSKWVAPETKDRLFAMFKRFGLLTVVFGSLMPPPMPFKPFVVLAGATGVPMATFVGVVVASRGFRYIGEAWLARLYGQQALAYMNRNVGRVSMWVAIVFVAGAVGFLVWKRLRPGYNRGPAA